MTLTGSNDSAERRFRLALGAILLAAFVLRVAMRARTGAADYFVNGYRFFGDQAREIAAGHGYIYPNGGPVTERPPLYAAYVALLHGYDHFWPILIAQALVSTGTVACAAAIAGQFFGRRAALVAAAVAAFYPYYVVHDTAMQETGLFTFLTALATLLLLRLREQRRWPLAIAAGAILGLAVLTRPTLLPMVPIAALWLLLLRDDAASPLATRAKGAAIVFVIACIVIAPWPIRQHALTDAWTMTGDSGRGIFVGNNPHTFDVYPVGSIDRSQERSMRALPRDVRSVHGDFTPHGRYLRDRRLLALGLGYIRADPIGFLVKGVRKNLAGFGVLPSPRVGPVGDWVHAFSYGPVLLLGLIGLWWTRRDWRRHALIYGHFLSFAGQTALLWAHTSHRAYLDVYLIVYASLPLVTWLPRVVGEKGRALLDHWLPVSENPPPEGEVAARMR